MKNYIPLLLSLVCASACAVEMPTKIRYYNSFNDAKQQKANYITIDLEHNSTKNHVRDELLRELGAGHLIEGTAETLLSGYKLKCTTENYIRNTPKSTCSIRRCAFVLEI